MFVPIIAAIVAGVVLMLLLARYAKDPALSRYKSNLVSASDGPPAKARISAKRLRSIVDGLLEAVGLHLVNAEPLDRDGATRLEATGRGAFRDVLHIIYVEASPVGELVGAGVLLELAEDVKHSGASSGIMITPCRIDARGAAGASAELDLIDGARLRELIEHHLPKLLLD